MIILRKFKNTDIIDLEELLEDQDIEVRLPNSDGMIYLSYLDEKLIGAIRIDLEDKMHMLEYIYIAQPWRNEKIGDGLLRVVIDNLDKQGIKRLYSSQIDTYLRKRGFVENEEGMLELDVENFFNIKCSCGSKNEV